MHNDRLVNFTPIKQKENTTLSVLRAACAELQGGWSPVGAAAALDVNL